jgi:GT2 family glycosyltransferase
LETNQSSGLSPGNTPLVSIIILNYNGALWLSRCLRSIREQNVFPKLEVIVADNNSPDGSIVLAETLMKGWGNGRTIQHGANLGFCEGNNRAAKEARGKYLFFLNNDTWLEPSCLQQLVCTVERLGARAGTPLMLNYEDDTIQSSGGGGFDMFGLMSLARPCDTPREIFVVGGCSYLIERYLFEEIGGFDPVFYMYADEYDLSWRVWISGARAIIEPGAKLHHRGAASVNPEGGNKILETRTSDTKRFYTNRNCLLLLLKNCQNILLVTVPLQIVLLLFEATVGLVLFRRWSFVKRAYWDAVKDCWRLRGHISSERRRIKGFRRRSDWRMLHFFRFRLNRWDEVHNLRRYGVPKVTAG